MADYKELIEALREEAEAVQAIEWDIPICTSNHILDAADAIEQLVNDRNASVDALKALVANIDAEPVRHARWVDNHCTACGMMPIGDEMWKHCDFEPPRFELFMDYCPSCGAKMEGDKR